MEVRKDKYKVGDRVTWEDHVGSHLRNFGPDMIVSEIRDVPEKTQSSVGHTQWVNTINPVTGKGPGLISAYWLKPNENPEKDWEGIAKYLQTKVDNQKNEIKDLTRKFESAKRVNRGIQRKKDLRLNLINELKGYIDELHDEIDEQNEASGYGFAEQPLLTIVISQK